MSTFKTKYSFEKRYNAAKKIREKYPDRVPIIVEKDPKSNLPDLPKNKYLVPNEFTVGKFIYIIRQTLKLPADRSMYMFINGTTIPATGQLLSQIDNNYRDNDFFVYILLCEQSSFGDHIKIKL